MRRITKQDKQTAQNNIMHSLTSAYYAIYDSSMTTENKSKQLAILEQQKQRIEKLFGFEKGSWKY